MFGQVFKENRRWSRIEALSPNASIFCGPLYLIFCGYREESCICKWVAQHSSNVAGTVPLGKSTYLYTVQRTISKLKIGF